MIRNEKMRKIAEKFFQPTVSERKKTGLSKLAQKGIFKKTCFVPKRIFFLGGLVSSTTC